MAVQYISYVKATDGSTYEIKDSWARQQIEAITGGDAVVFKGVSSTALTDGGNENPTVGGTAITAKTTGDLYFYNKEEFIYGDDNKWHSLGPQLQTLGNLAYKNNASATYTPAGTVSKSTFSGTAATITAKGTPSGTVSKPSFTGTAATVTAKGTPAGTVSQPSFSGTSVTLKVSGTPNGSVTLPTPSVTNSTVAVKQVSGVGSLPTYTASVENETLMFTFTQGALPTTASVNVTTQTGVTLGAATFSGSATTFQTNYTPAGTVSQPTFSGAVLSATAAYTPAGSVSQPTFTGAELSSTASYTPAGSVTQPTFSGTQATITVS